MEDKEEFGEITIDDQPYKDGWNKPVPYLSYWDAPRSQEELTQEQREFYDYLKDSIKEGKKVCADQLRGYLELYGQELCQAYRGKSHIPKSEALNQIITLVSTYGYSSYQIDDIIEKEGQRLRSRRINSYKIKDKAYWVPVGQQVNVDEYNLVRGGFYLGKFVEFYQYNTKTNSYSKYPTIKRFEGPAISSTSSKDKPKIFKSVASSFIELKEEQQQSLLSWLAGSNQIDIAAMVVYLSGFEVRLFGDKSITEKERIEDLLYLYNLLSNLPEFTGVNPLSENMPEYVTQCIRNMIDFTLARYYIDNAETILPPEFVETLPILINTRIDKGLSKITLKDTQESELAEDFKQFVKPPKQLHQVFHKAFYDKLAHDYLYDAYPRQSDFGIIDRSGYKYSPIYWTRQYKSDQEIESLLHVEPIKHSQALLHKAEKLKLVYARIMRSLAEFKRAVREDAPLLPQINALPTWCDTSLIPEVQDLIKELKPSPEQRYKLMKVSDLVKYFINSPLESDGLQEEDVNYMRMCLYRLGLSLAYPTAATMRLKLDDTTAIYDKSHHEVPNRGTISTSMFLIAWMIQADNVTDSDYALIDQWLRQAANGANWDVSAEAIMRWLVSHKLTMTAKRKIRVRALAKFVNKREQLQQLLLVLVNGEGFVLPKRMKRLETIYELVGLDPSTIHSDLHRLAIEGVKTDTASKPSKSNGAKGRSARAGMLNLDKLKEMEHSTAKAQEILSQVFTQEKENTNNTHSNNPPSSNTSSNEEDKKKAPGKKKKADSIVTLIEKLSQKPQWTREEFELLISKEGETYGAMLEKLNDYSYDKVDEALVEDDEDILYVDTDVANQLLD